MLGIGVISDTHGLLHPEALAQMRGSDDIVHGGDIGSPEIAPVAAGIQLVISGHSHCPAKQFHSGMLYLNPGSAGPRRFKLPM